jgi:hypothetical protein
MQWGLAQQFRVPVDPVRDSAAEYLDIVKHPVDLGTIRKKLSDDQYRTVQAFLADVDFICSNAILFDGERSRFCLMAADIRKWLDGRYREKPASQEDEWQQRLENVGTSPGRRRGLRSRPPCRARKRSNERMVGQ